MKDVQKQLHNFKSMQLLCTYYNNKNDLTEKGNFENFFKLINFFF